MESLGRIKTTDRNITLVCNIDDYIGSISDITITKDEDRIFITSVQETGYLQDYKLESGRPIRTLESEAMMFCLTITKNKSYIIGGGRNSIYIWDFDTGFQAHDKSIFQAHDKSIFGIFVTQDGTKIITASEDHTIKIWDFESGECLHTLEHLDALIRFGVSLDEEYIFSIEQRWVEDIFSPILHIYSLLDGETINNIEGGDFTLMVILNKKYIIASNEESINLFEISSGEMKRVLYENKDSSWITDISLTSDKKYLICLEKQEAETYSHYNGVYVYDYFIKILNTLTGQLIKEYPNSIDSAEEMHLFSDGKYLISVKEEGNLVQIRRLIISEETIESSIISDSVQKERKPKKDKKVKKKEENKNLLLVIDHTDNINIEVKECRNSLKENPKEGVSWYNLSQALEKKGLIEASIRAIKGALELDPDNPQYINLHNKLLEKIS